MRCVLLILLKVQFVYEFIVTMVIGVTQARERELFDPNKKLKRLQFQAHKLFCVAFRVLFIDISWSNTIYIYNNDVEEAFSFFLHRHFSKP